ncbi:MAG: 16S rRNA (guanine(966)-N(2))-methyltransferase RsmD, partial [Stenotrophomonas sp.]|nr:16S rRNA (guanine(966)-N(2))-methyltransferase RsmD [Stenotrophomonas sp.]
MDGATEPTWTYSRRPPQPDPPRQPTGSPLLTLLRPLPLLLRVQG